MLVEKTQETDIIDETSTIHDQSCFFYREFKTIKK